MNSVSKMESENTYSIKVIVRLRGYSQPIVKIKNKSLPESSNIPNKPNTNKYTTIPSPTLYHIFTSANKCNKVILTKEGLKQQLIMNSIKNEKDLIDINKTLLNKAKMFEFDGVYTDTESLNEIYINELQRKIKQMFNGYSCCVFTAGPLHSGKTYSLYGGQSEKGLIEHSIKELFTLIDISKQSSQHYYGICTQYRISITIYNVYLNHKDILEDEVLLEDYSDFDNLMKNVNHLRKILINKYLEGDLLNKSHLVCVISLYQKNEDHSRRSSLTNINQIPKDEYIQCIAKLGFVELIDSNYGLAPSNSPTTKLYANAAKTFNDLTNAYIYLSQKQQPKPKSPLLSLLDKEGLLCCGNNLLLILCASPCDHLIEKFKKLFIWGGCLVKRISNTNSGVVIEEEKKKVDNISKSSYSYQRPNTATQNKKSFSDDLLNTKENEDAVRYNTTNLRLSTEKSQKKEKKEEDSLEIKTEDVIEEKASKDKELFKIKLAYDMLNDNFTELKNKYNNAINQIDSMKKEHKEEINNLESKIEALTNELNELKKNKPQQKKEEISQLSFNKEDDIAITPKSTISISEDKMRLLTSFQAHLDKLRAKSEL